MDWVQNYILFKTIRHIWYWGQTDEKVLFKCDFCRPIKTRNLESVPLGWMRVNWVVAIFWLRTRCYCCCIIWAEPLKSRVVVEPIYIYVFHVYLFSIYMWTHLLYILELCLGLSLKATVTYFCLWILTHQNKGYKQK